MKREMRRIHWYTAEKVKTNDTKVIKGQTYCIFLYNNNIERLATLQFRLAFKDKGHKSLEHWRLVIHLTFVISTISNAESNAGIFILIGPLLIRHYKYTMKRTARSASDCQQIQFRLIFNSKAINR